MQCSYWNKYQEQEGGREEERGRERKREEEGGRERKREEERGRGRKREEEGGRERKDFWMKRAAVCSSDTRPSCLR